MIDYDPEQSGWEWTCLANIARKQAHGSITLRLDADTFAQAASIFQEMLDNMGVDEVFMVHIDKGESCYRGGDYD